MSNRRTARLRALAATLVLGLFLPAQVRGQSEAERKRGVTRAAEVAFDVAILRPVGVVVTLTGAALFVPAALISAPGGADPVREAWELFVQNPAQSVYKRPLGDF